MKKIVVRLFSGLGNQLFQYAAGRYYANRYGVPCELSVESRGTSFGYPRPFLLSKFCIAAPFHESNRLERLLLSHRRELNLSAALSRLMFGIQVIAEPVKQQYRLSSVLPICKYADIIYLVGYWQVAGIVEQVESQLRAELTLSDPPQGKDLQTLHQISKASPAISLHIRRGDYLVDLHGKLELPMEYYVSAIRYFRERFARPTFFVFSDDVEFARHLFDHDRAVVFVDHNDSLSAHQDLRLMAACQHHIIANSTFSWWGAWLNPRSDKIVYAPRFWRGDSSSYFPDLLPANWILADS